MYQNWRVAEQRKVLMQKKEKFPTTALIGQTPWILLRRLKTQLVSKLERA